MKKINILLLITAHLSFAQVDELLLEFPKNPKFSKQFIKAVNEQKKEYELLFPNKKEEIKKYSATFILDKIDNDKQYGYLFIAEYWIAYNYNEIIIPLIERITNKKEIGLINSADLIIWERIESGDMKGYGHGAISKDDLFTIAGRANRLLTIISGENFGSVSMYSTEEELVSLQNKWINWLKKI
ncbi:hypothetical protein FLAVO9AF_190037 [Flavobacterium sp. 9AF]|uniref:hypothetical protein n=1 Tax=Flavobacterium sp. 9AF TaxID=2653142 RepID=UPI0012F24A5C|nr:hypothetical protein [Flavobacterium sp. 9AF]VXB52864.1 hypothetical protein FLAVO9AF_190037 [Flavobacterium sp. 9AF]